MFDILIVIGVVAVIAAVVYFSVPAEDPEVIAAREKYGKIDI